MKALLLFATVAGGVVIHSLMDHRSPEKYDLFYRADHKAHVKKVCLHHNKTAQHLSIKKCPDKT